MGYLGFGFRFRLAFFALGEKKVENISARTRGQKHHHNDLKHFEWTFISHGSPCFEERLPFLFIVFCFGFSDFWDFAMEVTELFQPSHGASASG